MAIVTTPAQRFRPDRLPPADVFYAEALGKLSRPAQGWVRGNCPFHESRSKKSFAVNLDFGGFCCFYCGTKGGDIVAFVMERDGIDFVTAAKKLGCWDDTAKPTRLQKVVVVRDLILDFKIDGTKYTASVHDDDRDFIHLLRRIFHRAKDRLGELHRGGLERSEDETELQWQLMADSFDLIRSGEMSSER
jgi:hypothetical protein